ncbi:hypothetical protein Tco_1408985 [Tanacetum coccineum]
MIGSAAPFVLLLLDKLMAITNLHILVPVKLDIDEMNYSSWMYFFKHLCKGHALLEHILGKPTVGGIESSTVTPPDAYWLKIDSIILSWIFTTLAKPLHSRLIESIVTILKGLGSPLTNEDVVNIALERLPPK